MGAAFLHLASFSSTVGMGSLHGHSVVTELRSSLASLIWRMGTGNAMCLLPALADLEMMRLQDPVQTKILIVTLPETTPVLEAAHLQDDPRRAGIEPWGWIVDAGCGRNEPSIASPEGRL